MLFDMLGYLLLDLVLRNRLGGHPKSLADHIALHVHDFDLFLSREFLGAGTHRYKLQMKYKGILVQYKIIRLSTPYHPLLIISAPWRYVFRSCIFGLSAWGCLRGSRCRSRSQCLVRGSRSPHFSSLRARWRHRGCWCFWGFWKCFPRMLLLTSSS